MTKLFSVLNLKVGSTILAVLATAAIGIMAPSMVRNISFADNNTCSTVFQSPVFNPYPVSYGNAGGTGVNAPCYDFPVISVLDGGSYSDNITASAGQSLTVRIWVHNGAYTGGPAMTGIQYNTQVTDSPDGTTHTLTTTLTGSAGTCSSDSCSRTVTIYTPAGSTLQGISSLSGSISSLQACFDYAQQLVYNISVSSPTQTPPANATGTLSATANNTCPASISLSWNASSVTGSAIFEQDPTGNVTVVPGSASFSGSTTVNNAQPGNYTFQLWNVDWNQPLQANGNPQYIGNTPLSSQYVTVQNTCQSSPTPTPTPPPAQSANLSVNFNGQIAGQCLEDATISWDTQNLTNVQIFVSNSTTGTDQLFSSGVASGSQDANFFAPGEIVHFYLTADNFPQLDKYFTAPSFSCGGTPTSSATLSANFNGQIAGQCLEDATISWTTQNLTNVQIFVHNNVTGQDQLFSAGVPNGSQDANFFGSGETVHFYLTADNFTQLDKYFTSPSFSCGSPTPTPTPTPVNPSCTQTPIGTISVNPTSPTPGQQVVVTCDFGTNNVSIETTNNCTRAGTSSFGTGQLFDCVAPNSGAITYFCNAYANSGANYCSAPQEVSQIVYITPNNTSTPTLTCSATSATNIQVGGSVTFQASGGTAPYGFGNFALPDTYVGGSTSNPATLTYNTAGNYQVNVQDATGHSVNCASVTVVNNSTNGICGTANGQNFSSAPTSNLCTSGAASSVSGNGPWSWSCNGSNGGTNAFCSANKPAAVCTSLTFNPSNSRLSQTSFTAGSGQTVSFSCDYGSQVDSITTSGLSGCNFNSFSGTAANFTCAVPSNPGTYPVSCNLGAGTTSNTCVQTNPIGSITVNSAVVTPTTYTATATATASATANASCPSGASASATASASASATATSSISQQDAQNKAQAQAQTNAQATAQANANAQASANCPVSTPNPGICGSANGQTFTSAPSGSSLCSSGVASFVSGSGPWAWTCSGSNGGATASCSANQNSVPACVVNSNFAINASNPGKQGSTYSTTLSWSSTGSNQIKITQISPGSSSEPTITTGNASGAFTVSGLQPGSTYIFKMYDANPTCGQFLTSTQITTPANPGQLTCSAEASSVASGNAAFFTASGGSPTYSWSGGGSPTSGSGASFSTTYINASQNPVTQNVNVTSGDGQSANCSVLVQGTAPTPTPTPVSGSTNTNCSNDSASCNNNTNTTTQTGGTNNTNTSNQSNSNNINGNNNTTTNTNQNCVNNSCNNIVYISSAGNVVPANQFSQLSITKMVSANGSGYQNSVSVNPGQTVQFQIVVTNTGSTVANNVTMTDNLPSGLSLAYGNVTVSGGNGYYNNNGYNNNYSNNLNGINLGNLNVGQSVTINFTATVNSGSGTSLQNTATATSSNGGTVSASAWVFISGQVYTPGCTYNCAPIVPTGSVNLAYSKTAFNDTKNTDATAVNAAKEDFITYTLTVTNNGQLPANSFVITDDLSQVLPYADITDYGGGTLSGNVISYPGITVPANGSVSRSFEVRVKYSLASNLSYQMTNTYGNTVTIRINTPQTITPFVAPKTGADTDAFVFSGILTGAAAVLRKRKGLLKLIFT